MRNLFTAVLLLCLCNCVFSQTAADVAAPPSEQVVGLANFIHATNRLETTIAFYRDVFGLDAQPRPFASPAVAQLNNVPGVTLRLAGLKLPDAGFGFELTEFSNFEPKPGQAMTTDPGAVDLILRVRDMDQVLAALKKRGAPILSRSQMPVTIKGASGKVRSLLARDPDGYIVRAIEVPSSQATLPGTVQPEVAMGLSVADMPATIKFYHDLLGFDLSGSMEFTSDKEMLALVGAPKGTRVRSMSGSIPGSKARMEFYEFTGVHRTPFHLRPPDPGAPAMTIRVSNLDELLKTLKANGVVLESTDGNVVHLAPTSSSIFVEDPNGLNIELAQAVRPSR